MDIPPTKREAVMSENKMKSNENFEPGRRRFIKSMAFLGGCAIMSGTVGNIFGRAAKAHLLGKSNDVLYEYTRNNPENIIYSACLQCSQSCAVKCKIDNGVLVKIDGNAYSPGNKSPKLDYNDTPANGAVVEGQLCAIGQAGIGNLYNPARLRTALKRKPGTSRGAGEWVTVDFNSAIDEIVEGGDLFGDGHVAGLKDIYTLRDRNIAESIAADIGNLRSMKINIAEFKSRQAANLDKLIDPNHPDFGPKNNELVFLTSNADTGRKKLIEWFVLDSFGSVNAFDDSSLHNTGPDLAWRIASRQWRNGGWVENDRKVRTDYSRAEYAVFFGGGYSEPDFAPPTVTSQIANAVVRNELKPVVISPRMPRSASRLVRWIPINPGTEAAFAMGMLAWIFQHDKIDSAFLSCANTASAGEMGESSFAAASYLVKIESGRPSGYLRADEVGLGTKNEFVVVQNGQAIAVNPDDSTSAVRGDLYGRFENGKITARSAFSLLKDSVSTKTIEQYADICGVKADDIAHLAEDFANHGKRSIAEIGGVQTRNSGAFQADQVVVALNLLVGNNRQGGALVGASPGWSAFGTDVAEFNALFAAHPSKFPVIGLRCNREGSRYEESTIFDGYPSRRPWFPFSRNVYQEVIPSISDGYPYASSVLFMHRPPSLLTIPGGDRQIADLGDTSKIPLVIACGPIINDTISYADYIFPDTESWESWGIEKVGDAPIGSSAVVCQPAIEPVVDTVTVDGISMPSNLEAVLIAVGKKLGLPGFGKDAFGENSGFNHQDDWSMKIVSNLAEGKDEIGPVPDADLPEMGLFLDARSHLTRSIFDVNRLVDASGRDNWNKIVYILNRGGRFEKPLRSTAPVNGTFHIFFDSVATTLNPNTGKPFSGIPELSNIDGDSQNADYPFEIISYMEQSGMDRNIDTANHLLASNIPSAEVFINSRDAVNLGLKTGDRVRLSSSANNGEKFKDGNGRALYIEGRLIATEGIKPGVIACPWHVGSKGAILNGLAVDGMSINIPEYDNRTMPVGPILAGIGEAGKISVTDLIGGSALYTGSHVRLIGI